MFGFFYKKKKGVHKKMLRAKRAHAQTSTGKWGSSLGLFLQQKTCYFHIFIQCVVNMSQYAEGIFI